MKQFKSLIRTNPWFALCVASVLIAVVATVFSPLINKASAQEPAEAKSVEASEPEADMAKPNVELGNLEEIKEQPIAAVLEEVRKATGLYGVYVKWLGDFHKKAGNLGFAGPDIRQYSFAEYRYNELLERWATWNVTMMEMEEAFRKERVEEPVLRQATKDIGVLHVAAFAEFPGVEEFRQGLFAELTDIHAKIKVLDTFLELDPEQLGLRVRRVNILALN